ncbi:putative UDP-sugar transporter SLC35A4 [Brachionus plicatilis]|uniref:Putative UDP-sugar transporter SLC35A4 n=1 Tax=Brachionus plicatilis TaxID=10195 RepID=A0A3M7T540_BRAPC|nr:putative UDP-sugar transporter SLC35A4 [Brachionus plicatilis]
MKPLLEIKMEIFRNCSWYSLLLFQAFSYGSYTILVHLCEENGKISFNSSSMNLTIEFIKLFISSIGIIYQQNFKTVYIQLYMDSTSYQLLSNLKILTTAILYYFIIGKKMTKIRWFSLILLFFSGLFYSVGNVKSLKNYYINQEDLDSFLLPKEENINVKYRLRDEIYITEVGFFMILTYALISGLSGVYNEYLLKRNLTDSIFLQNFYLYMYGCSSNKRIFDVHCNEILEQYNSTFHHFFIANCDDCFVHSYFFTQLNLSKFVFIMQKWLYRYK